MKIDGEYLSHLRFADDILIHANTSHELQHMLQELADKSENRGLKMNKSKKNYTPLYVNNTHTESVETSVYLAQRYSTRDKNQDKQIERRIKSGWTVFAKHQASSRVTLEHA